MAENSVLGVVFVGVQVVTGQLPTIQTVILFIRKLPDPERVKSSPKINGPFLSDPWMGAILLRLAPLALRPLVGRSRSNKIPADVTEHTDSRAPSFKNFNGESRPRSGLGRNTSIVSRNM
jgi:hypothetical protein